MRIETLHLIPRLLCNTPTSLSTIPLAAYLFSVAIPPSEHRVLLREGAPTAHFFDHPVHQRVGTATYISVRGEAVGISIVQRETQGNRRARHPGPD